MHDIRFIRDNPEAFDRALERRGLPPEAERLIEIDARRRNLITGLVTRRRGAMRCPRTSEKPRKTKTRPRPVRLMTEVASLKTAITGMEGERRA